MTKEFSQPIVGDIGVNEVNLEASQSALGANPGARACVWWVRRGGEC